MPDFENTQQHILTTALDLFLSQGIKKTGLEEVARRAGVTRVTVYRYFSDKKTLVRAALMRIPSTLEQTRGKLATSKLHNVDSVLALVSAQISSLPQGDFPVLLDELQRVYPDIWQQIHEARLRAIEAVFNHLFHLAKSQGRLRAGLNRRVVQAYFIRAVVNVLEDPSLISQGLSAAEVFETVKAIFLHGILKEK